MRIRLGITVALAIALVSALGAPQPASAVWRSFDDPSAMEEVAPVTDVVTIGPSTVLARSWYRAWNGSLRGLRVAMPASALRGGEPLPLVIAVRPSGGTSLCAEEFGDFPGRYRFIVACIDGQGAYLRGYSFAAPGQIDDIAAIPRMVEERLPALAVDRERTYLMGVSMGAAEALLVALRHPEVARAVVALDPTVDLTDRHERAPRPRRQLMNAECNGPPRLVPRCYRLRSPIVAVRTARPGPRILLWYSEQDPVTARRTQIPAFVEAAASTPIGPRVYQRIGEWRHAALWWDPDGRLALLSDLGLAPRSAVRNWPVVRSVAARPAPTSPAVPRPVASPSTPVPAPPPKPAPAPPTRPVSAPAPPPPVPPPPARPAPPKPAPAPLAAPALLIEAGPTLVMRLNGDDAATYRLVVARDGRGGCTWKIDLAPRTAGGAATVRLGVPGACDARSGPVTATRRHGLIELGAPLRPGRYGATLFGADGRRLATLAP